jgi:hypothetical protein
MFQYVYGDDVVVGGFVASMIPATRNRGFGKCMTIGVVDGDQLIAGIVYHNWNPEAGVIEISCAALPGSRWMTRETIKRAYQYPFLYLGSQMVMQMTAADDLPLLRQLNALNYAFVTLPRILGPNDDGIVCLLTREAWLESKVCRRYRHDILDTPAATERAA